MPIGYCTNYVYKCPNCLTVHGGVASGGVERSCQACAEKEDCPAKENFENMAIIYKPCNDCLNRLFSNRE